MRDKERTGWVIARGPTSSRARQTGIYVWKVCSLQRSRGRREKLKLAKADPQALAKMSVDTKAMMADVNARFKTLGFEEPPKPTSTSSSGMRAGFLGAGGLGGPPGGDPFGGQRLFGVGDERLGGPPGGFSAADTAAMNAMFGDLGARR